MAFEDSSPTAAASRALGVGTGEYPPLRRDTATFEVVPVLATVGASEPAAPSTAAVPRPNLQYVFDDPNDGEPGRDRLLVHAIWEVALALALVGVGYAVARADSGALRGEGLVGLALVASVLGLLAVASAVALRAGVPNLAVGAAAVVAQLWVVDHNGTGAAVITALGACAAIGLVQGLVVVGLHVPSWAASLGTAVAVAAWVAGRGLPATSVASDLGVAAGASHPGWYDPGPHAYYWLAGVCVLSVGGSLVGLIPGVRRSISRFRPVADPARRRGSGAAVTALIATLVSTVLAGAGGVLLAYAQDGVVFADGWSLTALALGAALLGGTSAFGRRGGILGTVFAVVLLTLLLAWSHLRYPSWPVLAFAAAAIVVGLVASRLMERFGRPVLLPAPDDEGDWAPRVHALAPTPRPFSPAPTPTGGLWSADDGWGGSR
jgi:ribose/xylose/arabinose/galactoside ABC-type transport system permease subunit